MSTSRKLNIVYRIFVLLTAAAAIIGFVNIIAIAFKENASTLDSMEEAASSFGIVAKCFWGAAAGTAICLVMNFIACKSVSIVSVVIRTIMLIGMLGLQIFTLESAGILNKISVAFDKLGTLEGIANVTPSDIGMTAEDITNISNFTSDKDNLSLFLIAIMVTAIIYFIMIITSVVSLAKKDRTQAQ